jgi:hypothetical protein
LRHLLTGGADTPEAVLPFIVELGSIILQQNLGETVDAAQRRPQIVRHGIGEGFQLAIGMLQLGRAVAQVVVQSLNGGFGFPDGRNIAQNRGEGHTAIDLDA